MMNIPDIGLKIAKLKKYIFIRPLGNTIQKYLKDSSSVTVSSQTENDISMIQFFYKDIDWIVWTYEFYLKHVAQGIEHSADPTTLSLLQSLNLSSYLDFVQNIFKSHFVLAIQHINGMNQSRGTGHTSACTSPIMDLLLCGTDIPIPTSMYDLPKVLYYALQETKYSLSTTDETDSSASTNVQPVSLVYTNRNQKLQNSDINSNKLYHEVENMRYDILYLYILAHVAINITNVHNVPSDNNNHDTLALFNHTPSSSSTALLHWKDTFHAMIESHPHSSAKSMIYLAPIVIAMVQLEWYCHPSQPCCSNETTTLRYIEETLMAYNRCPLGIPLKVMVSDLLKDQYVHSVNVQSLRPRF